MADTDFIPGSFTVKSEVILKFFEALSILVFECRLHITRKGVHVIAVHDENIAMVEVGLDKFTTFLYDHDKGTILALSVRDIHQVLKAADLTDTATVFWYKEEGLAKFRIESCRCTLIFNCMDSEGIRKDPNPPTLRLDTKFPVLGSLLVKGIRLADVVGDCYIEVNQEGCFLDAYGETSKCRYLIGFDTVSTPVRSKYSLDYLKDIAQVFEGTTITIEMASDHPI
ncbi:hypothetical protein KKH23_04750, partial [Patescibacteria group bacterium]|nr:hypothetical protein [Patescibacteria group bacterium]